MNPKLAAARWETRGVPPPSAGAQRTKHPPIRRSLEQGSGHQRSSSNEESAPGRLRRQHFRVPEEGGEGAVELGQSQGATYVGGTATNQKSARPAALSTRFESSSPLGVALRRPVWVVGRSSWLLLASCTPASPPPRTVQASGEIWLNRVARKVRARRRRVFCTSLMAAIY